MKHFYTLLITLVTGLTFAQVPSGYYDSATGTGYTLKTQLKEIIDANNDGLTNEYLHNAQAYDAMDPFMATNDLDVYSDYENDGTILDVYSENPNGTDPYNFTPVTNECGNYSSEGDCYNKEHVIPKSVFNDAMPMYGDGVILLPTDGRVNGFRSNYPFGVVDDNLLVSQSGISNPTMNGSKLGGNLNSGYSAGYSGTVFEPIDEFKGDMARIYFYFATRYEDQIAAWSGFDMFDGSSNQAFSEPFLTILLTWHQNDPVSQKEIDRNNALFTHQNNRNPFVDHPEYVAEIWNATSDTEAPTAPTNLIASNPTNSTIDLNWTASTDNVNVTSYDVYINAVYAFSTTANSGIANSLSSNTTYCFTVLAKDAAGNESNLSNESCETTTNTNPEDSCADEDFENIPPDDSGYTDRTWTGNDGTWNATRARTDQTISNRAILIDCRNSSNGTLTSPSISGGIGDLTVTTQRIFTGTDGTLDVLVNGNLAGTIPYSDTAQTTTISDINTTGTIQVVIQDNDSGSARIGLDDLSWTCYDGLSTQEFSASTIKMYPNPLKGNTLQLNITESFDYTVYSVVGKQVLKGRSGNGSIQLNRLHTGMYIIKLNINGQEITKKLIKQ